ncbi:hypothetical protein [Empedobacter stercoris]|uniref:hypothetical protein n=1 Tax=Empedobacter stercoris TaxID=1628248 RepID=UPI0039E934D5
MKNLIELTNQELIFTEGGVNIMPLPPGSKYYKEIYHIADDFLRGIWDNIG